MGKPFFLTAGMVFCMLAGTASAMEGSRLKEGGPGGGKSFEDRVHQLEVAVNRDIPGGRWFDRIQLSGLVEVEAGYGKTDVSGAGDVTESDIDLATVELGVDAGINDYVNGHVLLKYEEDEVFMDEGFITLTGPESFSAYLRAGRMYVPFGNYDSFFVSDPLTLTLGETNEGAAVAGYRFGDIADVSFGFFNGAVDKTDEDDAIDSIVASIVTAPIEGFNAGLSYTSNIASSGGLSEVVSTGDGTVKDLVGGWSAFASFEFMAVFKIIGEYTAAIDSFEAGELYADADTRMREPAAWNLEFGAAVMDSLELAVRYGGADDGADVLPETQYGVVANWGFLEATNLALEYMHDEYEGDVKEADTFTAQLAIEF